jgi:hypothetical protein
MGKDAMGFNDPLEKLCKVQILSCHAVFSPQYFKGTQLLIDGTSYNGQIMTYLLGLLLLLILHFTALKTFSIGFISGVY